MRCIVHGRHTDEYMSVTQRACCKLGQTRTGSTLQEEPKDPGTYRAPRSQRGRYVQESRPARGTNLKGKKTTGAHVWTRRKKASRWYYVQLKAHIHIITGNKARRTYTAARKRRRQTTMDSKARRRSHRSSERNGEKDIRTHNGKSTTNGESVREHSKT